MDALVSHLLLGAFTNSRDSPEEATESARNAVELLERLGVPVCVDMCQTMTKSTERERAFD